MSSDDAQAPPPSRANIATQVSPRTADEDFALPTYVLRLQDGPAAGRELALDTNTPSRALVGHSPACSLEVPDPLVSRRHFAVEITPSGLRLTDLGSTNGTFVNGLRVNDAFVRGGDEIRIGDSTIHVAVDAPAASMPLPQDLRFGRFIGGAPEVRKLYPLCRKLADSEIPVLIEGETGTGKEVLAEALHEESARAGGPFVVFDCTLVAPNLVESTLFGHEKGAFTGATTQRKGVFEEADGGTLFIDEIGDLDLALQPKLLRALQRSEIQRVGSNIWTKVSVRILSATRRDLEQEIQAGRFRDDLFFRLAVGRIELPPLRQRTGDVGLLSRHFWRQQGGPETGIPDRLMKRFENYAWPGNIRELHHTISRYLALGEPALDKKSASIKPPRPVSESTPPPAGDVSEGDSFAQILALDLPLSQAKERLLREFERHYVTRVLDKHGGNVVRAAAASGIARRYFQILRARMRE